MGKLLGASLVHRPNLHLTALSAVYTPAPAADTDPAADAALALVKTTLGLDTDADTATLIAALAERLTPDPARYVPIAAVSELLRDRNSRIALMGARDAEAKVDPATERGTLTPAMRGWAIALCTTAPESFDGFLAAAPPAYAHLFRSKVAGTPPERAEAAADPDSIAARLGIDPARLR